MVLNTIKPTTFWDIGANIGFYSWFVKEFVSIQNIALFEPDSVNFALIQKTIKKNNLTNLETFNVAVSDEVGETSFMIDPSSGATGSLADIADIHNKATLQSQYGMGEAIWCATVTIDSLIKERPLPDFIKIDVEGAEHLVINVAQTLLTQHKPTMIIETSNKNLIEQLGQRDYRVFRIDMGN